MKELYLEADATTYGEPIEFNPDAIREAIEYLEALERRKRFLIWLNWIRMYPPEPTQLKIYSVT